MEATKLIKNTFALPQLWAVILPMQILGIYALYNIEGWWWIATLIGYICIKMIGVSAGYHRLFCHRGYRVNNVVKRIILYFGILSGQGSPITWVAIHRGYHHRHADTAKDLHSPRDGFWHSYFFWMFKHTNISVRSAIDLQRDPDMMFAHKHYIKIIWVTHFTFFFINVNLWLYLLVLPMFIALHSFLIQTSLTHYRSLGYRNYNVADNSVNIPWLFPIILGEAWHNNHHGNGRDPNYGKKWWELDPTFYLIKLIRSDK